MLLFIGVLISIALAFVRGTSNLQGHVNASAQLIMQALVNQARRGSEGASRAAPDVMPPLVGLGQPTPIQLDDSSPALGKTLAEINLRGFTGATVIAIMRGEDQVLVPGAAEVLREDDILALAGTQDAIRAALDLLRGPDLS